MKYVIKINDEYLCIDDINNSVRLSYYLSCATVFNSGQQALLEYAKHLYQIKDIINDANTEIKLFEVDLELKDFAYTFPNLFNC